MKRKERKKEKVLLISNEELFRLTLEDSGIVLRKNIHHRLRINYSQLPVYSDEFKNAISKELNKRILRFNMEMNDVILRFINIRVVQPVAANVCRKINVRCIADMFVFKPKSDQILTAEVNKKSKNHIGCVMYEVFNVSIVKPSDIPLNQWLGRDVEITDKINFKVTKIDVTEVIPFIIGELVPQDDDDDSASCQEIYEKDSVISVDPSSSEGHFSDLDDVLEIIHDTKATKRKRSEAFSEEDTPKRKKTCLTNFQNV